MFFISSALRELVIFDLQTVWWPVIIFTIVFGKCQVRQDERGRRLLSQTYRGRSSCRMCSKCVLARICVREIRFELNLICLFLFVFEGLLYNLKVNDARALGRTHSIGKHRSWPMKSLKSWPCPRDRPVSPSGADARSRNYIINRFYTIQYSLFVVLISYSVANYFNLYTFNKPNVICMRLFKFVIERYCRHRRRSNRYLIVQM